MAQPGRLKVEVDLSRAGSVRAYLSALEREGHVTNVKVEFVESPHPSGLKPNRTEVYIDFDLKDYTRFRKLHLPGMEKEYNLKVVGEGVTD